MCIPAVYDKRSDYAIQICMHVNVRDIHGQIKGGNGITET